jgi:hypothetical protein
MSGEAWISWKNRELQASTAEYCSCAMMYIATITLETTQTSQTATHTSNFDKELDQRSALLDVWLVENALGDPTSDNCAQSGDGFDIHGRLSTLLACLQDLLCLNGTVQVALHDRQLTRQFQCIEVSHRYR